MHGATVVVSQTGQHSREHVGDVELKVRLLGLPPASMVLLACAPRGSARATEPPTILLVNRS
jgi:hypothetical protein